MASSTAARWARSHRPLGSRIAEPEQHRGRLGHREHQVKPVDLRRATAPRPRQRLAGARVLAVEQASERDLLDLAPEPQARDAAADPLARRLGAGQVVVLNAAADAVGVGHAPLGLRQPVGRAGAAPKLGQREHRPV